MIDLMEHQVDLAEVREVLELHIDRCGDVCFETFGEIEMLEWTLAGEGVATL